MKQKKKVHIDTYESIYPVLLVVANDTATAKDISKQYCWADGVEFDDSDFSNCCGCVMRAMRKSDQRTAILVKISYDTTIKFTKQEKLIDDLCTVVHESGHVVLDTYSYIEDKICTDGAKQEPFCYFLEWVFRCIYTTMQKK